MPLVRNPTTGTPACNQPGIDILELTLSVQRGLVRLPGRERAGRLHASTKTLTGFQGTVTDTFTQSSSHKPERSRGDYLDAGVYDAPGVSITKVVFEMNGQVVATATPTY